ncbi:cold shock domain-containing protein [Scandinavium sp.]|uniref:cold shock domain-containing protein n=1 Tax=Scandinavium sp. TaxID=2830653 RepID=UPI00289DE138|nr:cold shock domain-containing protein [Scandinavium sp.]
MLHKLAGIIKSCDIPSGKCLITASDGRKDVLLHISAVNACGSELLISGSRIEFCRIDSLRVPVAANISIF